MKETLMQNHLPDLDDSVTDDSAHHDNKTKKGFFVMLPSWLKWNFVAIAILLLITGITLTYYSTQLNQSQQARITYSKPKQLPLPLPIGMADMLNTDETVMSDKQPAVNNVQQIPSPLPIQAQQVQPAIVKSVKIDDMSLDNDLSDNQKMLVNIDKNQQVLQNDMRDIKQSVSALNNQLSILMQNIDQLTKQLRQKNLKKNSIARPKQPKIQLKNVAQWNQQSVATIVYKKADKNVYVGDFVGQWRINAISIPDQSIELAYKKTTKRIHIQ
jgi:hypothetical protein